jgi:glycosyltransferase involved in cell wall biosynthesis
LKNLRICIIQRVLPAYRIPFFEKLAGDQKQRLFLFAGRPRKEEGIVVGTRVRGMECSNAQNLYFLGKNGGVCWQKGLLRWLRECRPDIIIFEANPRLLSHWAAIYYLRVTKRPVIGWGLGELKRQGPKMTRQVRHILAMLQARSFNSIIAYSTKAREDYIGMGVLPARIFIAHNSANNEEAELFLSSAAADKTKIRDRVLSSFGMDPRLFTLIFVGRLLIHKKLDFLISACGPLFERCQLIIVGEGPARPYFESCSQKYLKQIYFAGHLAGYDLACSYMSSDLFILPGLGGLAIHQAMSYGKPIIASLGDGTEGDLIIPGCNGMLFKDGDIEGLRTAICRFLDEPELALQMGGRSLAFIREKFNIGRMADDFRNAISATMAARTNGWHPWKRAGDL